MKKKFAIIVLLSSIFSFAQVSIGTSTPNASAILDVNSNEKGFLPPRMTTTARNAITSPAVGLTIYNTDLKCWDTYNGKRWINLTTITSTDVYSPSGLVWMDRNLGASQVATSSSDFSAFGSLFQWGRSADGHELITWTSISNATPVLDGINTILANIPGNVPFIRTSTGDWRTSSNGNLWQPVSGINNPCPNGYRVPTQAEWQTEAQTWTNSITPFNSPLKLIPAGWRRAVDGGIDYDANTGYYWTSTTSSTLSKLLDFNPDGSSTFFDEQRSIGYPVRCIKK